MKDNLKIILVDAYVGNIPSLGLAYLAGYLKEKRDIKNVKILQKKFCNNLTKAIVEENPDVVGYFSISPGFEKLLEIIKNVREQKPNLVQIIGGPHITALPESLPKEIDVAVVGEGELVLVELMDLYKKYNFLPLDKLHKIQNLVFRDNGEIIKTLRHDGIKNLDDLPKPARDLLDIQDYYPSLVRQFPTKIFQSSGVMTSRGCPFKCIFCQDGALSKFRAHSAERTVKEIEELVDKYKVNFLQIVDDQFLVNINRLKEIVKLICEKKIHKKTAFYCYLRANQITEETAKLLKQMNVKLVFIGFESGSDRILKYLKDATCSVEKNQKAYDLCRKNKIDVYGAFIVGSPDETMDDIKKTYEFIRKNRMATAEVFMLTPLPGTKIWDYALEEGLVNINMDWNKLLIKMSNNRDEKEWLCKNVSKQEYLKFYKDKIQPLQWHYIQTANDFKISDLFHLSLWKMFFKKPKFYLSVFKQSLIFLCCKLNLSKKYAKN